MILLGTIGPPDSSLERELTSFPQLADGQATRCKEYLLIQETKEQAAIQPEYCAAIYSCNNGGKYLWAQNDSGLHPEEGVAHVAKENLFVHQRRCRITIRISAHPRLESIASLASAQILVYLSQCNVLLRVSERTIIQPSTIFRKPDMPTSHSMSTTPRLVGLKREGATPHDFCCLFPLLNYLSMSEILNPENHTRMCKLPVLNLVPYAPSIKYTPISN